MHWRVTYGGEELFEEGTPSQLSWMTLKEALGFARR